MAAEEQTEWNHYEVTVRTRSGHERTYVVTKETRDEMQAANALRDGATRDPALDVLNKAIRDHRAMEGHLIYATKYSAADDRGEHAEQSQRHGQRR